MNVTEKVLREELEISDDEEEEIDGDAEELLCFERSELDGIRNIDKLDAIARKNTICVYFEDGKILVIDYKNSRKAKKEHWVEDYYLQIPQFLLLQRRLFRIDLLS
mgnify:CR=1 FL=1